MGGRAGHSVTVTYSAHIGAPAAVRNAVAAVARTCPTVALALPEVDEVCLAVYEACSNVVRHGLRYDGDRTFDVTICREPKGLRIVVVDDGPPFVLGGRELPGPEDLAEGGYGVHIVKACMDEVRVERVDDHNVLTLLRRYRPKSVIRRVVLPVPAFAQAGSDRD